MSITTAPAPPTAALLTAEDLWRMPDHGGHRELVRGELIDMPPAGYDHGSVSSEIGVELGSYVRKHKLGKTFAAETGFVIARNPDTVRAPDVAFIRSERLPARTILSFAGIVPDLVVEVISPTERTKDIEEKVADWLNAGVRIVWVLYPKTRTIHVHRPDSSPRRLTAAATLDGEDVVPGFSCAVAGLFA